MAEAAAQGLTLQSIDDLTATLLIQLQIEDAEHMLSSLKGKGRAGEPSDNELALRLHVQELESHASLISDRRMTRSIAQAVQRDGNILNESLSHEQRAARDREIACRLGEVNVSSNVEHWTVTSEEMNEEHLAKLEAIYMSRPEEQENNLSPEKTEDEEDEIWICGESSTWAATRGRPTPRQAHRCTACQEEKKFAEVIRAPCAHEYCRECIQDLFTSSMTDESLFPPRCCRKPIALTFVRIFLTTAIVREYEQKKIEFDTPNKTYCYAPSCSAFIKSENIRGDQATCVDCGLITCTMCKSAVHNGDCPADTALQQLLETATENGWQRCHNCRRLVELDTGCNHMTCKCGGQFCYVCGTKWKTCDCAQWNEDRLLARANVVAGRQPGPVREHRLAEVVQHLRVRHQCDHNQWRYVRGPHRCEECFHTLPSYIFECAQCRIQACNRCRRNRF